MKKRHNRLGALVLVLILCLALLPMVALAATTKLSTPTDLVWGVDRYVDGGQVVSRDAPGCISWQAQGSANFSICIYHADTPAIPVWETETEFELNDEPDLSGYYSIKEFNSFVYGQKEKADSGNYFFTVQALGDGVTTADSEIATSPTWAYTSNGAVHNNNGNSTTEPAVNTPTTPNIDEPSHIEWTFEESTGTLKISGTGAMQDYPPPEYGSGYIPWGDHQEDIKAIVIGEGITKLGSFAFHSCENATYVSLPSTLKSVGLAPFCGCASLSSFHIADGNDTFTCVDGMVCDKTQTVLYLFPEGKGGATITIPQGIKKIGTAAFFGNCTVTNATLPEGLTTLEPNAFMRCRALQAIKLPSTLTDIKYAAFNQCGKLTFAEIPPKVTNIEGFAFSGTALAAVSIPASVTHIGEQAFNTDLSTFDAFQVDPANPVYTTIQGMLYDKVNHILLQCPVTKAGELTIPDGVVEIGSYAFEWCEHLTSVTLPSSLVRIGDNAFAFCYVPGNLNAGLQQVYIPNGLTSIGEYAFYTCIGLKSVTIPESVNSIGKCAFYHCTALKEATIPPNVTQIGENAFNADLIMKGYDGSYAQSYAQSIGLEFISLPGLVATPNRSTVLVNGQAVAFDAYTINQNNYFKLRDLAKVLSGTGKQFEVTWDGANNAINMVSGKPYTTVGGELAQGDGTNKTASINTATVYLDGQPVSLLAYTINQNNYFKLRDVGQAFDFDVTWDGARNTIVIDTTQSYTAD